MPCLSPFCSPRIRGVRRTAQTTPACRAPEAALPLLVVVAVLAYASDQISKLIALDVLADGQPRPFVGDVIQFKLIGNPGAALSLGAGNTWVMTIIAVVVLVAIVYVSKDLGSGLGPWPWACSSAAPWAASRTASSERPVAGGSRRRLPRLQRLVHRQRR